MRRPARQRAAVLATAVAAMGMAALIPSTSSATASGTTTRTVKVMAVGAMTTYTAPNGDTTQIYSSSGPATMNTTVAAPQSATGAVQNAGSTMVGGSINVPETKTDTSVAPIPSNAAVLKMMGVPANAAKDAAAKQAANNHVTATKTASVVRPDTSATGSTRILHSSVCASHSSDGNKAGMYSCWNQYIVYEYSATSWIMADNFYGSAWMHDTSWFNPDELTGFMLGTYYGSGNMITNWDPKQTSPTGSCHTKTTTINIAGQSFSDSYSACPETYGFYAGTYTHVLIKWNGNNSGPNDGSREVEGTAQVYSPPGASASRTIYWDYWTD